MRSYRWSLPPGRSRSGFSLVELSVVVAIMSVVAVLGLESAANFINRTAGSVTRERIVELDEAVARFFKVYGRLPCPASITLAPTNDQYGLENCGVLALNAGGPGDGLLSGAIPFRTLNLPMTLSLDGYGSKFNYVVTKNLTRAGTTTGRFGYYDGTSAATLATSGVGGIEIRTGVLAQPCSGTCQIVANPTPAGYPADGVANAYPDGAAYIIFSSGLDKRGAYTAAGVAAVACIPLPQATYDGRIDSQNCVRGDNSISDDMTVTTIPKNVFHDSRYNTGFNEANYFDDYVIWRKRGQL